MKRTWTPEQTAAMTISGKTLLVSAAAGSGKTATLTERIIQRIVNGADISRMLIVTFTKSAAAELRSRIGDALTSAIAEHPDSRHLSTQLVALGSADIQTIDSFCLGPVREHFERLGLSASFRIADTAELLPLKRSILEDTATDLYERYENEAGNRFADFADNLMNTKQSQLPFDTLLDLYDKLRNFPDGIALLSQYAESYTADAKKDFLLSKAGKVFADVVGEELRSYLGRLTRAIEQLSNNEAYVTGFFPLLNAEIEYLQAIQEGLSQSYEQAYLAANTPAPSGSLTVKAADKTELGNQIYEEHKLYRKQILGFGQKYFYTEPEAIPGQLYDTAEFCSVLYELLSEFDHRIDAEKRARGICEFTDVTRNMLKLLLPDGVTPSELAQSLADAYDEVYIDEYQDVNDMQDRIFSLIGGTHRFMVGDIKQCIYAFRGSEPSLFATYRREFPAHGTADAETSIGNSIFMSDNFRCDQCIIDLSNAICRPLFTICRDSIGYRAEDDLKKSKQDPSDAYQSPKVTVAYFDHTSTGNDESTDTDEASDISETSSPEIPQSKTVTNIPTEAEWIANTIVTLLHTQCKADGTPIRAADIAVLARGNRVLGEINRQLQLRGVATTYSGGSGLSDTPEMKFLLNLLSVIDNPQADVPLHETLLHPVFGFSIDDLVNIKTGQPVGYSLYDAMLATAASPMESESTERARHAAEFVQWLADQRRLSRSLPADRFLRELYRDPLLGPLSKSDAFLCAYDCARRYQNSISTGLYQFLSYFREALASNSLTFRAGTADSDAVTMMTVHSSKGLEFPVCFLAHCGAEFSTKDLESEMIFQRGIGLTCRMSDHETLTKHSTLLRDSAILAYRRSTTEEEMRVLYVALTRARERLYISTTVPTKRVSTFLKRASHIRPDDEYAIRHAKCTAEWISSALAHMGPEQLEATVEQWIFSTEEPSVAHAHTVSDMPSFPSSAQKPEVSEAFPTIQERLFQAQANAISQQEAGISQNTEPTVPAEVESPTETLESKLHLLPSKIAASKVTSDLADRLLAEEQGGDGRELRARLELLRSSSASFASLLNQGHIVQATDRGTAAHEFLQFCHYDQLAQNGIQSEIDRLVSEQFLTQRTADIIDRSSLELFLTSELFCNIRRATSVEREVQFSLFLPYADFTTDPERKHMLSDRLLHIQGSIDLLLTMPDGSLFLVDYKTDRVPDAIANDPKRLCQFFAERHSRQLAVYRRAVEQLFERSPEHTMIYSIPLGRLIELPF